MRVGAPEPVQVQRPVARPWMNAPVWWDVGGPTNRPPRLLKLQDPLEPVVKSARFREGSGTNTDQFCDEPVASPQKDGVPVTTVDDTPGGRDRHPARPLIGRRLVTGRLLLPVEHSVRPDVEQDQIAVGCDRARGKADRVGVDPLALPGGGRGRSPRVLDRAVPRQVEDVKALLESAHAGRNGAEPGHAGDLRELAAEVPHVRQVVGPQCEGPQLTVALPRNDRGIVVDESTELL